MSNSEWYLEALQNYLNSSEWRDTIHIFIESHCRYFIQIDDYHPQQYVIWKDFQEIAENLLDNTLSTLGGSIEQLEKALDQVKHKPSKGPRDEVIKDVIDQLLSFSEFSVFASMMNKLCRETIEDEGNASPNDCDQNILMRMGFTVQDITSAYDSIGKKATS
jgi:Holliday junction resolvasome RuvABC DNA-binding subunit